MAPLQENRYSRGKFRLQILKLLVQIMASIFNGIICFRKFEIVISDKLSCGPSTTYTKDNEFKHSELLVDVSWRLFLLLSS